MLFGWWKLGMDVSMLAMESQEVILQRINMLAKGGPAAHLEAQRMVSEKVFAASETLLMVAAGASNQKVVRNYRRKVQANARRLSGR